VLLGEREVEYGIEYSNMRNSVYSIYDDLKNLNTDKVLDITISKLGIAIPNVERLIHEIL